MPEPCAHRSRTIAGTRLSGKHGEQSNCDQDVYPGNGQAEINIGHIAVGEPELPAGHCRFPMCLFNSSKPRLNWEIVPLEAISTSTYDIRPRR